MQFADAARDIEKEFIQAHLHILTHRFMQSCKAIIGLFQVFGHGILQANPSLGNVASIEGQESLFLRSEVETLEGFDNF